MEARASSEVSEIKPGEKVVCIDDTYQRVDLGDAPDGVLVRGQVYCVAGWSACGGLSLVGLRAVSSRTGKEVGFHPSRFHTLEHFRLKYPGGVISMLPIEHNPHLADHEPTSEEPIVFPEVQGLMEPRPLVERAIDILEAYRADHCGEERSPLWLQSGHCLDQSPEQVREELLELLQSPALIAHTNLSVTFWRLVHKRRPTVLFCRKRSPVANTLLYMCMPGDTLSERLLQGEIKERDFPRLTGGAGRFAHAPIRICDARETDTFLRVLFDVHEAFDFAICDWKLAGEELAAAYRLTRDSHLTFLCPE